MNKLRRKFRAIQWRIWRILIGSPKQPMFGWMDAAEASTYGRDKSEPKLTWSDLWNQMVRS